eukprot:TRINITY_DN25327_c0_g1_i1.p1 TRINITY_DN25327_c0_g1~~TRINITY_DN25327_c0_g1_i1.p1  ORF type:complete len:328 (+),score=100.50 TRINITY_DN25327_c0_g1_i1:91-1074(+)
MPPYEHRVAMKVEYLTSNVSLGTTVHFFQVLEQLRPGDNPMAPRAKRMLVLVDRSTYMSDLETAINRCVAVSKIEVMGIFPGDLELLRGEPTQYDILLQMSATVDFVRTIGGVFKANDPENPVPVFEMEEAQPIAERVFCKPGYIDPVEFGGGPDQRDVRVSNQYEAYEQEIAALNAQLQKVKEEHTHDVIDLKTTIEELRTMLSHSDTILRLKRGAHSPAPHQHEASITTAYGADAAAHTPSRGGYGASPSPRVQFNAVPSYADDGGGYSAPRTAGGGESPFHVHTYRRKEAKGAFVRTQPGARRGLDEPDTSPRRLFPRQYPKLH